MSEKFRLKVDTPKEGDIQRACLKVLSLNGFIIAQPSRRNQSPTWILVKRMVEDRKPVGILWRRNTGRIGHLGFGIPGESDVCGVLYDGRVIGMEFKTPGKKLKPEQQAYLDIVNEMGGVGVWFDSVDGVLSWLKDMNWKA